MTALSQDDVVRSLHLCICYYFVKPFNMDSLISRVIETPPRCPLWKSPPCACPKGCRSLDERIANVFWQGIPAHIKGTTSSGGGEASYSDRSIINSITKELYPALTRTFDTTASKVERAIAAYQVTWARGKTKTSTAFHTIYGKKSPAASSLPLRRNGC